MKLTTIRGERVTIPANLASLAPILKRCAALHRAERRMEKELGKALTPLFKRLKRKGDAGALVEVAALLTDLGTMNGRFFYEEAYRAERRR